MNQKGILWGRRGLTGEKYRPLKYQKRKE